MNQPVETQPKPQPVVIDTSSLIPAFRSPLAHRTKLLDLWTTQAIRPFITPNTLEELRRQLLAHSPSTDHYQATRFVDQAIKLYRPFCQLVRETIPRSEPICRDSSDQKFIDLTAYVHAQYLITRDDDLLALNPHTTFDIIRDDQFIVKFP